MEIRIIQLNGHAISYELKSSRLAKNLRLEIGRHGLRATKPWRLPDAAIDNFIMSKSAWVIRSLAKTFATKINLDISPEELPILKRRAAKLLLARLEYFNIFYQHKYQRLSVRDQKTRWGSCTNSGTLSFNCRLALLPEKLLDYVVVHELCHTKEMNHSARFWLLVAKTIPDYLERRRELRQYNLS